MTFKRSRSNHAYIKLLIMENFNAMTYLGIDKPRYFIAMLYHLDFPDTVQC